MTFRQAVGRLAFSLALCIMANGVGRAAANQTQSILVTEPEYEFGDAPDSGVFFSWPSVVVDPERHRVLALDAANSQVSVWTLDGSLLFTAGQKGEGPGEFRSPGGLFVESDGVFSVQEIGRSRFTYFNAEGELLRVVQGPGRRISYQGLGVQLHSPDENGIYLGVPLFPAALEVGTDDVRPVNRQPILRVRSSGDAEWYDPEPLLWLDRSNRTHVMRLPGGGDIYGAQPFGDPDQVRFEPGKALVMRLTAEPGAVELVEVNAEGDTVWQRQLRFAPRRLTPQMVSDAAEVMLDMLAQRAPTTSRMRLRQVYEEGLYKPEYVPPVEGSPVLTTSGEVWFRTTERSDTLRMHYVIRRGDQSGDAPSRVLLPARLWISDATNTHVWGVVHDSLDVPRIVGRRLVARR